jgi:hypothetical protein
MLTPTPPHWRDNAWQLGVAGMSMQAVSSTRTPVALTPSVSHLGASRACH